jgi:hypothetical protein
LTFVPSTKFLSLLRSLFFLSLINPPLTRWAAIFRSFGAAVSFTPRSLLLQGAWVLSPRAGTLDLMLVGEEGFSRFGNGGRLVLVGGRRGRRCGGALAHGPSLACGDFSKGCLSQTSVEKTVENRGGWYQSGCAKIQAVDSSNCARHISLSVWGRGPQRLKPRWSWVL